jgi:CheY-like chemotaxis protein
MKRRIVAAIDDLFFASKVRATAAQVGVQIEFVRDAASLLRSVQNEPPALIIFDLQAQRIDPFATVETLKANEQTRPLRTLGFFAHVQTELLRRAQAAGFDQVLPRSAFTQRLPELLAAGE